MSKICILLFAAAVALTSAQAQYKPSASLYANYGGTGAYISLPNPPYANDLSIYGFDNRAYSVCFTGAWLFYDLYNFNGNSDTAMEYFFEPSFKCADFTNLGGYVSSAKYVGNENDYRVAAITFFQTVYFQGAEEYVYGDVPNLQLQQYISSLIITGQESWTVYDQPNYAGQGICLTPFQNPYYTPAFVTDTLDVSPVIPHGSIASVRKGCFSTKIVSLAASPNRLKHTV